MRLHRQLVVLVAAISAVGAFAAGDSKIPPSIPGGAIINSPVQPGSPPGAMTNNAPESARSFKAAPAEAPRGKDLQSGACRWGDIVVANGKTPGEPSVTESEPRFIVIHKGEAGCQQKTKDLPERVCAGKAICGTKNMYTLCEASGKDTCPTATECVEKGIFPPGASSMVKAQSLPDSDGAFQVRKIQNSTGHAAQFVSGSTMKNKGGTVGICAFLFKDGEVERPVACLADNCTTQGSCMDDRCADPSSEPVRLAPYPGIQGHGAQSDNAPGAGSAAH